MIQNGDEDEDVRTVMVTVDDIRPLLAGKGPKIQGAILCELVGLFLAGFPVQARQRELFMIASAALDLAVVNEHIMHGDKGHPDNDEEGGWA